MKIKVVATEVAEQDFQRFLDAMDLTDKCDAKQLDAEDLKAFNDVKRTVVRAIEHGSLVIDEKGQPVFTPTDGDVTPITFHEPTGADIMALDQEKKTHEVKRTFKLLAALGGVSADRFAKMKQRDSRVCSALLTLFLS